MKRILPIVEGQGDVEAIQPLIYKVLKLNEIPLTEVRVLRPQRRGEWPTVKRRFSDYFRIALLEKAPILWMLDFDCHDCIDPEADRAWMIKAARDIDPHSSLEVAFMVKEYESLFMNHPGALEDYYGIQIDRAALPHDCENKRGVKEWISKQLPSGRAYKETTDQRPLTSKLDALTLRQHSPSFRRFEQAVLNLLSNSQT